MLTKAEQDTLDFHRNLKGRTQALFNKRLNDPEAEFSDTLELSMELLGLTYLDLARATGVYSKTVQGWLSDEKAPTAKQVLAAIAYIEKRSGATINRAFEDPECSLDTSEPTVGGSGE